MAAIIMQFGHYTSEAKRAIKEAERLAKSREHSEVEPEHLLFKLVEDHAPIQEAISRANLEANDVLVEVEVELRRLRSRSNRGAIYLSPRMNDLIGRAEGEAARERGTKVGVQHLMLACSQEPGPLRMALRRAGLNAAVLRAALAGFRAEKDDSTTPTAPSKTESSSSSSGDPLEKFGIDWTRKAAQGHFDPVVGRDAELRRVIQVLARRRENNPLLVGEAGIGKKSIVQALAMRIAKGDVPKMLQGKRIVSLDLAGLVAGAKLRGQLEERMRSVVDAIRDSGGETLLCVPSLRELLSSQTAGAANMLAGALQRQELRIIAAAEPGEARKAQEENAALFNRFVGIPVEAPTLDEAIAVMRGVVERFETAHGVRIADPALVSAAQFARRYVPEVQLPKSAIDIIDEAAARVRVEMESVPAELDSQTRRLEALEIQLRSLSDETDQNSKETHQKIADQVESLKPRVASMRAEWDAKLASTSELRSAKQELAAAQRELDAARGAGDHARAGELMLGTIPDLKAAVEKAEGALSESDHELIRDQVHSEDVADVVASWTGVPVSNMMEEETEKLLKMEDRLRDRVVGQDPALLAISKAVRRGRVGLRDPKRPIGSFLFLGPTGVGKTELAKALAEFLFDDEASLTRLDMSEFMEKHMVARLLGSPPGYVDSDQGGFLTEAVRQRPYSVVLFDEMEKAHPDVFNVLLQVLDDGRLTDSRGRLAHFSDTVVIMTSNVGSHLILDHEGTPEELRAMVEEEMHRHYRPEFLNRIDDVVIFNQLGKEDLSGIADILLRKLGKLLGYRRIGLEVTDPAKAQLVELGYEPAFGARPLKRVILKELQDPLAEAMLRGGYQAGDTIVVGYSDEEFTFTKKA